MVRLSGLAGTAAPPETKRLQPREALPDAIVLTQSRIAMVQAEMAALRSGAAADPEMITLQLETEGRLHRTLAALEAIVGQLTSVDVETVDQVTLTALLDAAQGICDAVEGLLKPTGA